MIQQTIIGFSQDEEGHWIAHLLCGHTQHVRHDPPWQVREWTQTEAGRAARVGHNLRCILCEEAAQSGNTA